MSDTVRQRQDQKREKPIERLRKPGTPDAPPADGPDATPPGIEDILAEIDAALGEDGPKND